MKETPNIGEVGVNSIRIGGMTFDDLPIAEAAHTRPQIPIVIEGAKQNKIHNIKAKYPKPSVAYLQSRIRECQENVKRCRSVRDQRTVSISEYAGLISLCEIRDQEIAKLRKGKAYERKRVALGKQFGLWNVDAMKVQVDQFTQDLKRFDDVISQEHDSIAELREHLGLCQQRDAELRGLGVKIA